VIQHKIEDRLSDDILAGVFCDGDSILIDMNEDKEIVLTRVEKDLPENEKPVSEPA
jgi:hypothetical protein